MPQHCHGASIQADFGCSGVIECMRKNMLGFHLGGVAGGGGAALLEDGLEGAERLGGHAGADAVVLAHHNVLLVALHTEWQCQDSSRHLGGQTLSDLKVLVPSKGPSC